MPGLVDSRKGIYGDYNRDGLPDICIIGGGYDEPPYPGGSPVILMSNATNSEYKALRNEIEWKGFWHGGTSGDFDNDGDLDIFFIQAWHGDALFFINDGGGNFTSGGMGRIILKESIRNFQRLQSLGWGL